MISLFITLQPKYWVGCPESFHSTGSSRDSPSADPEISWCWTLEGLERTDFLARASLIRKMISCEFSGLSQPWLCMCVRLREHHCARYPVSRLPLVVFSKRCYVHRRKRIRFFEKIRISSAPSAHNGTDVAYARVDEIYLAVVKHPIFFSRREAADHRYGRHTWTTLPNGMERVFPVGSLRADQLAWWCWESWDQTFSYILFQTRTLICINYSLQLGFKDILFSVTLLLVVLVGRVAATEI